MTFVSDVHDVLLIYHSDALKDYFSCVCFSHYQWSSFLSNDVAYTGEQTPTATALSHEAPITLFIKLAGSTPKRLIR